MSSKSLRQAALSLLLVSLAAGEMGAQMTVTGSISGTVTDPSGQVIAGAKA